MQFFYVVFDRILLAILILSFMTVLFRSGTAKDQMVVAWVHDAVVMLIGALVGIIRGEMKQPPAASSTVTESKTVASSAPAAVPPDSLNEGKP